MTEFIEFPKIPRLSREVIITEKLDGTNAQVLIGADGTIRAGSRNRWLSIGEDNYGFARWVEENSEELLVLGVGRHFGEWWGQGIQRKYNISEKRFSLFNVKRWNDKTLRPACCHVVPTIWTGVFHSDEIENAVTRLKETGSAASPGFMNPEGVVIYHVAAQQYFKKTIEKDNEFKSRGTA